MGPARALLTATNQAIAKHAEAILKGVAMPEVGGVKPFIAFLQVSSSAATAQHFETLLPEMLPGIRAWQWLGAFLANTAATLSSVHGSSSNGRPVEDNIALLADIRKVLSCTFGEMADAVKESLGESVLEHASRHLKAVTDSRDVAALKDCVTQQLKEMFQEWQRKGSQDDADTKDVLENLGKIVKLVEPLQDTRLNEQMTIYHLLTASCGANLQVKKAWEQCASAEEKALRADWVKVVSPLRVEAAGLRRALDKPDIAELFIFLEDADYMHLPVLVDTIDPEPSIREALSEVEITLRVCYNTWTTFIENMTATLEQNCPPWRDWIEKQTFPSDELIKELLGNKGYPQLTPIANKLDGFLAVSKSMAQADACGSVLTEETLQKARLARDHAFDTVSFTYSVWRVVQKIPEMESMQDTPGQQKGRRFIEVSVALAFALSQPIGPEVPNPFSARLSPSVLLHSSLGHQNLGVGPWAMGWAHGCLSCALVSCFRSPPKEKQNAVKALREALKAKAFVIPLCLEQMLTKVLEPAPK